MTVCWHVLQVWNRGASGNTFAQRRTAARFLSHCFHLLIVWYHMEHCFYLFISCMQHTMVCESVLILFLRDVRYESCGHKKKLETSRIRIEVLKCCITCTSLLIPVLLYVVSRRNSVHPPKYEIAHRRASVAICLGALMPLQLSVL